MSKASPTPTRPLALCCAHGFVVVCVLLWCGLAGAQPALDDRYQTKLPREAAAPPIELGEGRPGAGGGSGQWTEGEGEPIDLGEGGGDGERRDGEGIRGMLERIREHHGEPLDGEPSTRERWQRGAREKVFYPDRFDENDPPPEGSVEWYGGNKWEFRDGEWVELGPPQDGDVERRLDDHYTRRFEDGQWGDWQPPPDGAVDWDDGYKRTFEDGQWSDWQPPEEGDVELRGDKERVFHDGQWSDWQERSTLADRRDRQRPHDVDSDDLADNDPMMQRSPQACECGGINLGGSLGGVGQAIFWIVLIIALLGVIVLIARHLRSRAARDDDTVEDDDGDDDDLFDDDDEDELDLAEAPGTGGALLEALDAPLPDHERLAAEGRWAEALHALLLHVLAGLLEGRSLRTKSSLTSRELVDLFGLDAQRRDALWRIVEAVEVSHFGMRPTTRDGYETARADARVVQTAPATDTREAA